MNSRMRIALVVLVVAAGFWGYETFGTATIAITSEPTGAMVRVDGRLRGVTPLTRLELDTGNHRVEVIHSHLQPFVEGLSLRRGDHIERHVQLKPGTGTLQLMSNPRGAWVEVDGERVSGRTPVTIEVVSGPHNIAMGQEERHIVEQEHTVKHGETREVNFNLNIDPHGSVTMTTAPRGARIEFIGEDVEYRPKMRMRIGEVAVRISKPGYVAQEFRYKVRYGDNLHHVKLERDFGNLVVRVTPTDADVRVTYEDEGRTLRKPYQAGMRVPVGRVEVQARALGHRTGIKTIRLGNKGATVRFSLSAMTVPAGKVFNDTLQNGAPAPHLVVIPAGSFIMGDDEGPPSEQPAREVTITQPFAVSRYEITIGDYLHYLRVQGRQLHERLDPADATHAVGYVDFADAVDYAEWLSDQTGEKYRLLSEAEWEYVARAGSTTHYFWGNDKAELCRFANIADRTARKSFREWDTLDCDDYLVRAGPVGSYEPNPFGVYDIYGNVSEWVLDCGMPDYDRAPNDGSAADEGSGCASHGIRGGSWDSMPVEARSTYRNVASTANDDRGIRLLRVL